jgi:hypothetical protein
MNEHSPESADGFDLDRLRAEIRASLAGCPADQTPPELAGGFDAELRAAGLRRVEKHADIAATVPELPRFRGPLRMMARLLAGVVLYVSRFLTSRQRESNYAVLNSLRNLHHGLSRLEQEQARQLQRLRADLERLERRLGEEGRQAA